MVPAGFEATPQPPAKVPNYFDQFDEPAPAPNPFEQFHKAPAATQPLPPGVSLGRLRGDPVLGPEIAHLPDNSGRVIDLVTKDMGARGQALSVSGEGFNPLAAERYSSGAADARDILRDPARGGT